MTQAGSAQRKKEALAPGRQDWATWPRYEAATTGFREYW